MQIYATTEERKQRNRQAQAAFRERRTEYIKQLEDAIRVHENNLNQLQIAHRSAADECLMLRYKNSLLERILLEKGIRVQEPSSLGGDAAPHARETDGSRQGIDVQLELRAKTGSPNLGPTHMPQNLVQPPPIQRAIMNRHHAARRSASSIKTEPGAAGVSSPLQPLAHASSPKTSRPTPSSHSNSPGSTSNAYGSTTSASPVASDPASSIRTPTTNMMKPQIPPMQTMPAPPRQPTLLQTGAGSRGPFFSTPSFQNHYEQLGKLARPFSFSFS